MSQNPDQSDHQFLTSHHYNAWQLIKLYWQSDKRFSAYVFLTVVLLMTMFLVAFDVAFSYWANYFYTALQEYDKRGVIMLLGVFCVLAFIHIITAVYRYYLSQLFGLRWRRWLTDQFLKRWLENQDYYYLEIFDKNTDNPDQRIQEDVGALVTSSIALFIGLISSVTTFFAFIFVLWSLSGVLTIPLGPLGTLHVPGYLVWVAIIYSIIGTLLTFKIGRPLIMLNFEQQRREATFRFAAIDLRSHSEDVALYRGEEHQKRILDNLFQKVLSNWYAIILRQKLLLWFTAGFNQVAVVLPLLVALPNYFSKVFMLGGVMQSIRAFGSIQDALAFLINSYTDIAQWRAVTQRLTTFLNHMQDIDDRVHQENHVKFNKKDANVIGTKNLTLYLPDKKPLLTDISQDFVHGQNYLIKGASGVGKSTFVRALAGIWPYGKGEVELPKDHKVMYIPQKPYMPIGTLADAILFPDNVQSRSTENLPDILRHVRLEHLIPRLNEKATWSDQLSPGEQQRIGFARILLNKPSWVFLDESTSMLDLANEEHLYRMLKKEIPNCSIISVGHRPSLDVLHDKVINIQNFSPAYA